jgi:tetratricopeptide (TPR) repeat protein
MHMRIGTFLISSVLVLTCAAGAAAQSGAFDIRAVGEHRTTSDDTPETAARRALVDAQHKAWRSAAARLQRDSAVRALRLEAVELAAYVPAILEIEEPVPPASAGRSPVRVAVRARLDPRDAARRMAALHVDQDASFDLIEAWTGLQRLHEQLARDPQVAIRHQTKLLAARASAALARTEQRAVGGRAPSSAGQQRARELVDAALALWPDSPDAHAVNGDLFMDALEPESAEAAFRKALAGDAESSSRRTKLAEALRLQGRFADAAAELREALRIDPASARAYSGLGLTLRGDRKITESVAAYREAIRLDPDLIDAHNGLAVVLANQGKLAEAVEEFREIIRVDPDSAIGYYNLAYALADLDRDVESAAALREVIRINPDHYNARFNLGELFRLEAKYDESAKQFREYLRLAPDAPQNRRNIERARDYIQKFEDQ